MREDRGLTRDVMPLEQQKEHLERHMLAAAEVVYYYALAMVSAAKNNSLDGVGQEILNCARWRLEENFPNYGDSVFRMDDDDRRQNIIEEMADSLVYAATQDWPDYEDSGPNR